MRELIGLALATAALGVLLMDHYGRRGEWGILRSAEAAGESLAAFTTAAEDYIDANFAALWTATQPTTDPVTGITTDTVTGVSATTLQGTGLLGDGWQDEQPDGRRHWLAVRRDPSAANSLLALAFTYPGTSGAALQDGAPLLVAARSASVPLGFMTGYPGDENHVVGSSGAWRLARSLFAGSGQALSSGQLAAAIYVSEGRVLGPWLCREAYQDRPECNIARTATTIQPDRGTGHNTDAALRIDVPDATDTDATTYQGLVVRGVEAAPDWASVPAVTAALYGTTLIDISAVDPAGTTPALQINAPNTAPGLVLTGTASIDATSATGTAFTVDAGAAGTAMAVTGGVSVTGNAGIDVLGAGGLDVQDTGDLEVSGSGNVVVRGNGDLTLEGNGELSLEGTGDLVVEQGDVHVRAGTVNAQTFWQTSDPIAKTGLARAGCDPELRARLASIRLHRWTWANSGRGALGYNAAEVANAFPELVEHGPDGLMRVDYPALLAAKAECAHSLG